MKYLLEVCVIATLAIAPSVAAQSAVTAPANSGPGLRLVRRAGPTDSGAQALQKGISVELPVTSNAAPMPTADNEDALWHRSGHSRQFRGRNEESPSEP